MSANLDNRQGEKNHIPFLGNGTEWVNLLISLFVAAVVWLLYNLSLPYSVFLDYPVNINTNIPGYEADTKTDQRLIIRGKTSGFYVLHRKFTSGREAVEVKVDSKYSQPLNDGHHRFKVASSSIRSELSSVLGDYVDIEYILSDTLTFQLVPTDKKRVPVRLNALFECASQYHLSAEPVLMPDSVYISGASSLISSINEVWTERIYRNGLDANVQAVANLNSIKGLDMSVNSVMYSLEVKRYIEESLIVPITVRNLPPDRMAVIVPDHVTVTFRRWYPLFGKVEPKDIELVIDYDDSSNSSGATAVPVVTKCPAESFNFETKPALVECIYISK